ncbi:flavodoxin family protein [Vibrio sp. SCSIO 43136]|uniref:flavodoxin family protein n=1 Tax=Vibrio sp. SCSIO 43136 TaxID=2819101 RepID=UPI002075E2C3|nr:flavodoxin family protein [Vibrio sp. SCSIO 43136]USD66613.1 flavodoxin family protein [Vibrio sp. SCSIO 43136]
MVMAKVAVIYFSKAGSCHQLALQVAEGISQCEEASPVLIRIDPKDIVEGRYENEQVFEQLKQVDGIIFGSPTYMGSAAAQFKAFMDESSNSYVNREWDGKIAAGFTCGGSINGEQEQTLLGFFVLACQHGMVWAGLNTSKHFDSLGLNRLGSNIGLTAHFIQTGEADPNDLATARYLGHRVAQLCQK